MRDIDRGAAFYRDQLGFAVRHQEGGFAIVSRDAVEIHLWLANDERWRKRVSDQPVTSGAESFIAGTASCRLRVRGIDALYAALHPLGIVHHNAPLTQQSWGDRDFAVLDPDGNLITFFES